MQIQTAVEKVMARQVIRDKNAIPPMTHPYGKHWDQPPTSAILIDDTHAVMSQKSFDELHDYSATLPTGAYEGKMWKRHNGIYDPSCPPEKRYWLLCWFGFCDIPDNVSINARRILIV